MLLCSSRGKCVSFFDSKYRSRYIAITFEKSFALNESDNGAFAFCFDQLNIKINKNYMLAKCIPPCSRRHRIISSIKYNCTEEAAPFRYGDHNRWPQLPIEETYIREQSANLTKLRNGE